MLQIFFAWSYLSGPTPRWFHILACRQKAMLLHLDDAVELYVRRIGSGPPMLVLHGGMGFDHTSLLPWLETLGNQCELIVYDQRGNGRSSSPADWSSIDETV